MSILTKIIPGKIGLQSSSHSREFVYSGVVFFILHFLKSKIKELHTLYDELK